jgi:hypothetical protein
VIIQQTETQFDDPSLARADQAEEAKVPKPVVKVDQSVAALIKKFERENKVPDVDKIVLDQMDGQRRFVHTDANLPTTPGGVSTNYLLKFQQVHKSQINARDPAVAVRPKKRMPMIDQMTGEPIEDPVITKQLIAFSKTMQNLITHYFSADEMDIKGVMDGAIQDVDTVGICFLKLDWLEDIKRDPVGAWRPSDFQGTVARMKRLLAKKAAGECKEGDASYQELKDTAEVIHQQMQAELWRQTAFQGMMPEGEDPRVVRWDGGIPTEPQLVEMPKYRGFVMRNLMPEDCRRDWNIFRPEEFRRSRWFAYRTYMTEAQIREFYEIPEDQELLPRASPSSNPHSDKPTTNLAQNPADRADLEAPVQLDRLAVWVRMDREANKYYHWVEGSDRWLREPETPELVTTNWFNVFPLYFNRVTGRFLPVSNTTLGKPLQEEINLVRTHKRQAKRAAYDRYAVTNGLFDKDDLDAIESCPPNGMFMTKKNVEDLMKGIYRMPGQYNEEVHNIIEERQELGSVLNQSQAAQGMTKGGSDSATEAAIANQTSDSITAFHRDTLENLIRAIGVAMGEILVQALPEENAKSICGPGAYWPRIQKEQLWAHLVVEIEAGSTGLPDQQKRLDGLKAAVDIGTAMGLGAIPGGPMWNPLNGMKKLAEIMDWRDDPKDLVMVPPPLPPMPAMAGPKGAGAPAGGGPQVPTGGVPPAAEMAQEVAAAPIQQPTLPMVNNAPVPPGA